MSRAHRRATRLANPQEARQPIHGRIHVAQLGSVRLNASAKLDTQVHFFCRLDAKYPRRRLGFETGHEATQVLRVQGLHHL